jgi:hypothetical protein
MVCNVPNRLYSHLCSHLSWTLKSISLVKYTLGNRFFSYLRLMNHYWYNSKFKYMILAGQWKNKLGWLQDIILALNIEEHLTNLSWLSKPIPRCDSVKGSLYTKSHNFVYKTYLILWGKYKIQFKTHNILNALISPTCKCFKHRKFLSE